MTEEELKKLEEEWNKIELKSLDLPGILLFLFSFSIYSNSLGLFLPSTIIEKENILFKELLNKKIV